MSHRTVEVSEAIRARDRQDIKGAVEAFLIVEPVDGHQFARVEARRVQAVRRDRGRRAASFSKAERPVIPVPLDETAPVIAGAGTLLTVNGDSVPMLLAKLVPPV